MIEDIDKNPNKSLADNEIASLMKTLASKSFRENSSFPKKVLQPFKPISFLEVAKKNLKTNDKEVEIDQSNPNKLEDTNDQINQLKDNEKIQIVEDVNDFEELKKSDKENDDEIKIFEYDKTNSDLKNNQPIKENIIPTNETNNSEKETNTNVGIPVKETLYSKDDLNKEYQKGFSDGKEEEQKKYITEKKNSIESFDGFIKKVNEKIFIDTKLIENNIKDEIIKIVKERTGVLINEMPREFLDKVKKLSNTIIKKSEKKVFKLNPEDLKSVQKIIETENYFKQFDFLADEALSRGDCIIEVGEISLEDKIADRYGSNDDTTKYLEIDNIGNLEEENFDNFEASENDSINSETTKQKKSQPDINQETNDIANLSKDNIDETNSLLNNDKIKKTTENTLDFNSDVDQRNKNNE